MCRVQLPISLLSGKSAYTPLQTIGFFDVALNRHHIAVISYESEGKNSSTKKLISREKILRWWFFGNIINILLKLFPKILSTIVTNGMAWSGWESKASKLLNYFTPAAIDWKTMEIESSEMPTLIELRKVFPIFFTSITKRFWFLEGKKRENKKVPWVSEPLDHIS